MFRGEDGVISHDVQLLVDIIDFFLKEEDKLDQVSELNTIIFHFLVVVE